MHLTIKTNREAVIQCLLDFLNDPSNEWLLLRPDYNITQYILHAGAGNANLGFFTGQPEPIKENIDVEERTAAGI